MFSTSVCAEGHDLVAKAHTETAASGRSRNRHVREALPAFLDLLLCIGRGHITCVQADHVEGLQVRNLMWSILPIYWVFYPDSSEGPYKYWLFLVETKRASSKLKCDRA